MQIRFWKNRDGSALLVALLVMGVLMAISLAVSTLVLREGQVTRSLLDSGQAYYGAESGVELALYGINHELPGWQPTNDGSSEAVIISDQATAEYSVANRCTAFPCFDGEFQLNPDSLPPAEEFYYTLDLNQTLTIPLFIVREGDNEPLDVGNFTVEFWSPLDPATDLDEQLGGDLSSWDVLRWKILGIENDTGEAESISDFTALSETNHGETTSAEMPSWFGTVGCSEDALADGRYHPGIDCVPYGNATPAEETFVDGQVAGVISGDCDNTQAREYYDYMGMGEERNIQVEDITPCYSIKTFMDNHGLNYLTLTNFMNPAVLRPELDPDEKKAASQLHVRVELFPSDERPDGNKTVREFAHIKASGVSGKNKKTLEVMLQKGSFMPVFNFSLYSTYQKGDVDYYGDLDNPAPVE